MRTDVLYDDGNYQVQISDNMITVVDTDAAFEILSFTLTQAMVDTLVTHNGQFFKEECTLLMTDVGHKKIQLIKQVRLLTSLGLKAAKDLVESPLPVVILATSIRRAEEFVQECGAAGVDARFKIQAHITDDDWVQFTQEVSQL